MIYYMSGLQFNNQTDFNRANIQTPGTGSDNVVILEGRNTTPSTSSMKSETRRPQFSNERFEGNRGISTFLAPFAKNHFLQKTKGRIACS